MSVESVIQALKKAKPLTPVDVRPVANLATVLKTLREVPGLASLVQLCEMRRQIMLMHPVPEAGPRAGRASREAFEPRPLTDEDVSAVQEYLQWGGLVKLGQDVTYQALKKRASECSFHPVREWLSGLSWDGEERLERWLSTYLGAEVSPYTEEIGSLFLVAAVARVFSPGAKADYLLVLEGPQGAGKSSACRALAGEWFDDNLPDLLHSKEVSQALRGRWIIEIPELAAMRRAEETNLKAFLSRTVERFRPPYGRSEVIEPRQCVFIGTTNAGLYLRDHTGGRRFWPVRVGKIDTQRLAADRDQLFAEAVHKYRAGFHWWPEGGFERDHITPQQADRREADAWEELVRDYLEDRRIVLVSEVGKEGLRIDAARLGTSEQRRIANAMLLLGWERKPVDSQGKRWWARPGLSDGEYLDAVRERRRADSAQRNTADTAGSP